MNQVEPAPGVGPGVTSAAAGGFVEWAPIIAGAVLASALSFVLLTFGTAIGLSATSPWPHSGLSAKVVASIAVFWTMVQQIGAFMAGAYVAGRMRAKWRETSRDEVEFRDGLHGGLVWAVGVVIGAALIMMAAGGTARTTSEVAGTAVSSAASTSEPMEAVLDTMLRPSPAAKAPPAAAAAPNENRKEISRILTASVATGTLSNENRTYLAQLVGQRTGLSQRKLKSASMMPIMPLAKLSTRRGVLQCSRVL